MAVGFETIIKHVPREVLKVKDHYAYLEPVIARLPEPVRETLMSAAPDEVRRLKDTSAAEIMALGAAEKALESCGLEPSDIDGLLVTQTGGRQFMPLLGPYIHLNMGLNPDALVRSIVDDNASVLDASYVAWNFVRSGLCKRVLVIAVAAQIGGEIGFGVDLTDPLAQNFGDGAAAAIVSSRNLKCEFLAYHFETYAVRPRTGGTLIANFGDVRPLVNPDLAARAGVENKSGAYLVLEDPLFDEIAGRRGFITESLERAMKKAGLELTDLNVVIAPHIGKLEATWVEDLMGAGLKSGVYRNLRRKYGNMAVADTFVDLAEFSQTGQLKRNDVVALWSPCVGVQLAALVLRWLS